MNIGAIVLAAGFSSRFGGVKLVARLSDGTTVLQKTLTNLKSAVQQVLVVTRPDVAPMIADQVPDLEIFNGAENGMGATLAFAMQQVMQKYQWDGCLICLADMPFIRPETYQALCRAIEPDNIVIPCYSNQPGNPAGFGSDFFPSLAGLSGDQGGRGLVKQHPNAVLRLEVHDPGILQDIDTPDDLIRYQQAGNP